MSFYPSPKVVQPNWMLSNLSRWSIGLELALLGGATIGSLAFPSANRVLYMPLNLDQPLTALKLWCANGAVVSGKVDMAIYDPSLTRMISVGTATNQAGASVLQTFDITDTYLAGPATYMLAISLDNTTGRFARGAPTLLYLKAAGMSEENPGGFGCPSSATPASLTSAYLPVCGIQLVL